MADQAHVNLVHEGKDAIAKWRSDNVGTALNLRDADLANANLGGANLGGADLRGANLGGANLGDANLRDANLRDANLRDADLVDANLRAANLRGADLGGAAVGWTVFGALDLAEAKGLDELTHRGPSVVGVDTLGLCGWKLPPEFLTGCGFAPWEILHTRMYDSALSASEICELQVKVFDLRSKALAIGGVFISYSRADSTFVDKLAKHLTDAGVSVWLDRHDMVAGDIQKQVSRAIRLNDVVVVVLSEASIKSAWVENELDMARQKEQEDCRDVLCPVALDESWKRRLKTEASNRALWRSLTDKLVVDFSKWKTKAFQKQFERLLRGLKINYEPPDE